MKIKSVSNAQSQLGEMEITCASWEEADRFEVPGGGRGTLSRRRTGAVPGRPCRCACRMRSGAHIGDVLGILNPSSFVTICLSLSGRAQGLADVSL